MGGTNFDLDAGDEAHSFSFKGPDPHSSLVQLLSAASKPASALFKDHLDDLKAKYEQALRDREPRGLRVVALLSIPVRASV